MKAKNFKKYNYVLSFCVISLLILGIWRIHHQMTNFWILNEMDFGDKIRTGSMFELKDEWVGKISFYGLDETIDKIKNEKISLARFGNGELDQILKRKEVFQKPSKELSFRLKEVLSSTDPQVGIGLPLNLFTKSKRIQTKYTKKNANYWTKRGDLFRSIIVHTAKRSIYFPTEMTSREIQSERFFNKIRTVWQDRDVHLIHGKGIFDGFKYDIFDNAKSITHQIAPNQNAFEEYDKILDEALKVDKNKLVIIVLGPTATILAYDLAKQGYQALDLGHIAKNYDWYKRGFHGEYSDMGYFYGAD